MGKEYMIDIRIWAAFLALAYSLGRMDIFGRLSNNQSASIRTITTATTEPSSQHFQLDLKGAEFLQKDRLIQAITDASKSLDTNLVSATCQGDDIVTCLGVLEQGQISIQVWPQHQALSVDVIQYGSSTNKSMLISQLQQAFGAAKEASFWSLDYRGQAIHNRYVEAYSEVSNSMICKVKELLVQEDFGGKKLEIWNILDIDISLRYEDALAHNLQPDDPRWTNNELAKPMREAYLDGHTMVTTDPENQFFLEIFVHPAIWSQENPNKIAILGGPGSIIRETLKSQLHSVTWFQPDEKLVSRIQEFIPETYDCSDLQGRSDNCLEDSTITWRKEDAKDYFFQAEDTALFDVILTRVERPNKAEDLSSYVASVLQALSPDGALMLSLGEAPTVLHPRGDMGHFGGYEKLFQTLEGLDDVHSMMVFEEDFTLSGFSTQIVPETFMLVCKSVHCRQRFFSKPEWFESQLPQRYISRNNGKPILEYYDGAVQTRIQVPPKAYEAIYCRREPMPMECAYRTLDFGKSMFEFDDNVDKSAFEVMEEGVRATVDIPVGAYIMAKDLSRSLLVSEETLGEIPPGRASWYGGERSRVLEVGISGRIRNAATAEESNVGYWFCPSQRPKYSPVFDRHFASFDSFLVATKDISRGEELVRLL